MAKIDRANFGSKLGVILASAGSAVGLGNIWRFPYETGNHGGAAFILIYLGCIFLLGLPIMIAEFLIGRRSRANTARAYQTLAPGTHWRWVGRMGVLAGFLILSYYAVVAGWTLEYILEAATNGFAGKNSGEFISSFQQFSSSPWRPVVWLVAFLLITHFIIVKGVEKGIEKSSKIMMPTLFIIILILVVCSVTLPGAGAGIEFLLKPDFSKVDGNVFLSAMGQAFFSLSLGMGCLCTYASYFIHKSLLGIVLSVHHRYRFFRTSPGSIAHHFARLRRQKRPGTIPVSGGWQPGRIIGSVTGSFNCSALWQTQHRIIRNFISDSNHGNDTCRQMVQKILTRMKRDHIALQPHMQMPLPMEKRFFPFLSC
mgnify:CR=1 FL=1